MSDLQLIDDLCDICVQLAGIVRRQSETHGQIAALKEDERAVNERLSSIFGGVNAV